jgi:hypothetical protein
MFIWGPDIPSRSKARADATAAIRVFMRGAGIVLEVRLEGNAQEVTAMRLHGQGREAVFLVNAAATPAAGLILHLRRTAPTGQVRVFADLQDTPCPAGYQGGDMVITLPPFERSCIVLLGR